MTRDDYQAFTDRLRQRLAGEDEVLGLVALGSMSGEGAQPDEWSDHDFFVVVRSASQERFRARLDWLPEPGELALSFRETEHGLKVILRTGHLLEFAVFDPEELRLARVNRYRVLLDRERIGERMAEVRAETGRQGGAEAPGDDWLAGQLLADLLVGAGRARRGERLAGRQRLAAAAGHLMRLAARHLVPAEPGALDDLDPARRFERAFPDLAAEIEAALRREVPEAARALFQVASRALGARLPPQGAAAVARRLDEAAASR
ncbi:MAG TPA: hypothetical protein VEP68_01000 [Anaeromyxobacteraceae bacterium]|nr:hypothetical protein [Anaeromyxobacteraceae bacterium]